MKRIAFDLGASSGKMMLGEFDGERLRTQEIHRFTNRQVSAAGGLYWDFLGIYRNLAEGIRKGRALAGEAIGSLGMDSFCNDFGLVGRNGALVTQMHCYRDPRAARWESEIYRKVGKEELHRMTGNQNALFNTVIQLAAMQLEGEGYLLENGGKLLHLPDLLSYLLTGRMYSEYTMASVTQMFDYGTDDWHQEILRRFGITEEILSPVLHPGQTVGRFTNEAAREIGVEKIKVVAVGEHDTASAVAALPITQKNIAYISSGTWSLMGVETEKPVINADTFRYNIAIEGGVEHRYRMLKNIMGLWLVQECRLEYIKMGKEYSFEELSCLAEKEQPFRSLVDPDDPAFYMPGNMLEKIQTFCQNTGQPVPETPGQFVRTAKESLAFKYRWVMEKLETIRAGKIQRIHILGGGGQDRQLNQFTADACGRPVDAGPAEAALMGNFLMQMKADGEIADITQGREILARSIEISTYDPRQTAVWEEHYQYFKTLLRADCES